MRHKKSTPDPVELGKKLGRAIAERRKGKNLTQDDLAGLAEVDAETISRMERGTTLPSIQRLFVIAGALDSSAGELLSSASPLASDRAQALATVMQGLRESDQQLLIEFANLLARR